MTIFVSFLAEQLTTKSALKRKAVIVSSQVIVHIAFLRKFFCAETANENLVPAVCHGIKSLFGDVLVVANDYWLLDGTHILFIYGSASYIYLFEFVK